MARSLVSRFDALELDRFGDVSAPDGIRTRVASLKERNPRPLDDGDQPTG